MRKNNDSGIDLFLYPHHRNRAFCFFIIQLCVSNLNLFSEHWPWIASCFLACLHLGVYLASQTWPKPNSRSPPHSIPHLTWMVPSCSGPYPKMLLNLSSHPPHPAHHQILPVHPIVISLQAPSLSLPWPNHCHLTQTSSLTGLKILQIPWSTPPPPPMASFPT